jgi:oligoribonuclease
MNKPNYPSFDKWVFIDMEMTGLDEEVCSILQVAMIITDPHLNEIASCDLVIWQPESALQSMIPFVKEMHTKNGLLDRVRKSKLSVLDAERHLMEILTKNVLYRQGVLAGNSMYIDRRFLQKYMSAVESYLHYREIDVTSIKVICEEWYKVKAPKPPSTHTALEDIRACIAEIKYYKENCFKMA